MADRKMTNTIVDCKVAELHGHGDEVDCAVQFILLKILLQVNFSCTANIIRSHVEKFLVHLITVVVLMLLAVAIVVKFVCYCNLICHNKFLLSSLVVYDKLSFSDEVDEAR